MPLAGHWVRGEFEPIQGLCDFMLILDGKVAIIDVKSINQETFKHSMIEPNQLKHLREVGDVCPAGYVVCFRPLNKVIFFPWYVLSGTKAGTSLEPSSGIDLGPISFFSIKKIFTCNDLETSTSIN